MLMDSIGVADIMTHSTSSNTRLRQRVTIGPEDHGRLITLEEFHRAKETQGFVYEIIDGVLIVSPNPKPIHDYWVQIVRAALAQYAQEHPERLNHLTENCEVVIPARPGITRPQPDIAAYRDFPDPPPDDWSEVCPVVVAEVISDRREKKDVTRNRQLYWAAGGVMEYWIIDPREDERKPLMIALVRRAGAPSWEEHVVPFGKSHKSTILPRFTLNLRRAKRKGTS